MDMSIIFPTLDFKTFKVDVNSNLELVLRNDDGVVIDRAIHALLTQHLRFIHVLEKNMVTGYDRLTKDAMIEDDQLEREIAATKEPE